MFALQRFAYHGKPIRSLAHLPIDFGQQYKKVGEPDLCSRGSKGSQALTHLLNSFRPSALLPQRPTVVNSAMRCPQRKPLLSRERDLRFRPLLGGLSLPTVAVEFSRAAQRPRQTKRVRQLLSQGQRLLEALQTLLGIPQHPQ